MAVAASCFELALLCFRNTVGFPWRGLKPVFGYIRIRIFESLSRKSKVARMRSGFVVLTALLLSGSAAVAQAGKPCADDIKKLCAGIQPGEGRIKACIKSHLTELSPTCQDVVLTVAVTGKV